MVHARQARPDEGPGKGGGAKIIHVDPRFSRTSAVATCTCVSRTGTDVALFGGLMNYVLQNNKFHDEYVRNYTNASFIVKEQYGFSDGLFNGYDPKKRSYEVNDWNYELGPDGFAQRDMTHAAPALRFSALKSALRALHAGNGRSDHRHTASRFPEDRRDRRRDGSRPTKS